MCRAILPMCGNVADVRERIRHAVSVSLTLVNTAVLYVTKSRQDSILRGFCALAMSMSGAAEARERRTATAARVCQRRTAAIPPSAARTAGFAVNDDGGQAQRRHRVCQGEPSGVAGHPLDEHRACVTSESG